jgi:hypothetical protein
MGKVFFANYFPYLCETPYGPVSCFDGDLNGFMRMYWRVRTWKVTATLTGYTNPDGSIILPGPGDYIFTYGWNAQTEEDLVCERQFQLISAPDFQWDETIFFFFWALQSKPSQGNITNYQPGFDLFIRPGDDAADAETAINREGVDNWAPVTINIDNFGSDIMSLTYYTTTGDTKWGAISLKVEAESYWPYGGTYDTTTGEPL